MRKIVTRFLALAPLAFAFAFAVSVANKPWG
jgi:hypothetical protein